MMAVAPRGLTIDRQVEIVDYVKGKEIKPGEMESESEPLTIRTFRKLGNAIQKAKESGHSNIPVVTREYRFLGMFTYKPSEHDLMDLDTPIEDVMKKYNQHSLCREGMSDKEIKDFLKNNKYRFTPVLKRDGTLSRLVFLQTHEAYKVGAAIDTHPGWERKVAQLVEAGADMIFIDTSDAHKEYALELVREYNKVFGNGPPICAGNVVTRKAFRDFAEAGADAIKLNMGPGSICSTNQVLGVGAPPMWVAIEVAQERDEYAKNGKYIPIISDGGMEGTDDISVVMTHVDGIMCGSMFGGFHESAGDKIRSKGRIVGVRIYGEASKEAFETTGDMNRYSTPMDGGDSLTTFQGVSGLTPYMGMFKPGLETYKKTLSEALYHAGCANLREYREKARLIRLSEGAKRVKKPHGIDLMGE
jgi:IMP dehydrogenase